jgi:hypothetical protein
MSTITPGPRRFDRVFYIARFGVAYNGRTYPVFAHAVVDRDGELTISGVEGPKRGGNCWGSCGQIILGWQDDPARWTTKGANFNDEQLAEFMAIWDRWHLNHMYHHSSAWKREELPAEVIEKLASFPASSLEPAWV